MTSDVVLEIDHVIPVSRGGSNAEDNLTTACRPCNFKKGPRPERRTAQRSRTVTTEAPSMAALRNRLFSAALKRIIAEPGAFDSPSTLMPRVEAEVDAEIASLGRRVAVANDALGVCW